MAKQRKSEVTVKGVKHKLLRNLLLMGGHEGFDYTAEPDKDGNFPSKKWKKVTGEPDPLILDIVNLQDKLGADKFRCIDGPPPKPKKLMVTKQGPTSDLDSLVEDDGTTDPLDGQTPEQLTEVATSLGIELEGDESADDIRAKIREAQ